MGLLSGFIVSFYSLALRFVTGTLYFGDDAVTVRSPPGTDRPSRGWVFITEKQQAFSEKVMNEQHVRATIMHSSHQ